MPRLCGSRMSPGSPQLGVIASMQPSHASDDLRWADARLGPERVRGAYAWRWFADAGVTLAHGSDFPVEIVNPFWGIYAGVTRQDADGNPRGGWHAEQRLSLEETLRGFTSGAAYAGFAEDRLGVLKPGYRADLTVIDRDIFQADPAGVLSSVVVMTLVDGKVAFEHRYQALTAVPKGVLTRSSRNEPQFSLVSGHQSSSWSSSSPSSRMCSACSMSWLSIGSSLSGNAPSGISRRTARPWVGRDSFWIKTWASFKRTRGDGSGTVRR